MKHILIVDNSEFIRTVAGLMLADAYKISTAKDGEEAIKFLENNAVDLTLMAVELPRLNGIDTLKQMKLDKDLREIPVIFLTGITRGEVEEQCLKLGANDFITKPFNEAALLRRIERTLENEELKNSLKGQVFLKTQEVEKLKDQVFLKTQEVAQLKKEINL